MTNFKKFLILRVDKVLQRNGYRLIVRVWHFIKQEMFGNGGFGIFLERAAYDRT